MIFRGNLTARQAADRFAQAAFEKPRQVGQLKPSSRSTGPGLHATFRLVDGSRWYEIWLMFDYSGWSIEPVFGCPV